MTDNVDKILKNISKKIKEAQNTKKEVITLEDDTPADDLLFLSNDMIVSDGKNQESLNLEKQAKIICYDIYENLDLEEVNMRELFEVIYQSLKNINK